MAGALLHAISTLHRWGDALLTGDELIVHKAFSGQGAEKKITSDIERYIISKFNDIYERGKYKYSSIILSGIEEIFKEKLTSEAIRPIINAQKKGSSLEAMRSIKQTESLNEVSISGCRSI